MIIFFSGSICIHPQDLCSGKTFQYQTLNLLGAGPESSDIGRPAYRAFLYVHGLIAAVMADQPAVSVGGERHVTVRAFHYMAAGAAGYKTAVSSPVQDIFAFDTEVYSNTGGQASKASNIGQVAQ